MFRDFVKAVSNVQWISFILLLQIQNAEKRMNPPGHLRHPYVVAAVPRRQSLRSHRGSVCHPELHPSPPSRSLPSPLPWVVAIPERRKGESAPVNMPGWRSQWRLILLNSLTCGLEICLAAGITYVPPLLLEAGVEERYMTMVLGKGVLSE